MDQQSLRLLIGYHFKICNSKLSAKNAFFDLLIQFATFSFQFNLESKITPKTFIALFDLIIALSTRTKTTQTPNIGDTYFSMK